MSDSISDKRNGFRLFISLVIANCIRLLKILPNNDPIMSMALPFSRRSSALTSFMFPFATMVSFDIVTGNVGLWTAVTSITYGALGLIFHYLMKGREKVGISRYLGFGVLGVLLFDLVTGVIATPMLFPPMTFWEALVGQVPFTAMHLLTTSLFILIVTPLLDKQVLVNERLADNKILTSALRLVYG
jgi:hypothetical protein